jgi:tRNA A37 N6-isopentenylltransferase MiaA
VKIRTRQFAKRQLTWFRAQKNLDWIELKPDDSIKAAVEMLSYRELDLDDENFGL